MEPKLPQGPSEEVDPDILAGSLVFGRMELVSELFTQLHKRPPMVIWSPTIQELPGPVLQGFAKACLRMSDGAQYIADTQFDVSQISAFSRWLMIVDVVNRGEDFTYAYYGAGIAKYFKTDMSGRRTSEFGGFVSEFFSALYRAAMIRKHNVFSQHEPPQDVFVRCWDRLIFPIVDSVGDVVRFAVLNLARNELRAGLDAVPTPCMVADREMMLVHANPAAENLLTCLGASRATLSLKEIFGVSIAIDATPAKLVATQRMVMQSVRFPMSRRSSCNDLLGDVAQAAIGGASFGARNYYVLSLASTNALATCC